MSAINNLGEDPVRQQLLTAKVGRLLLWSPPKFERTIGPFFPDAFDAFEAMRQALINTCRDRLASFTDQQVEEISQVARNQGDDAHGWRKFQVEEVRLLQKSEPEWFAGGFGHPDHVVDFEYWAKMVRFTVSELTCLSVGINPNEFDVNAIMNLASLRDRQEIGSVLEFLVLRFEQLQRAFSQGRGNATVNPILFLEWAQRFDFAVHPEFLEPLQKFYVKAPVSGTTRVQKQDQREVDKIAQLFTAMAIDTYGYVPGQVRSPTTTEIGTLAAELGMSISDETIRKYLQIGAEFISPDWKPNKR